MSIALSQKTRIMGILNVTPDSFYDGGRFDSLDKALSHAERMCREGADIIDIGGESSRPGANPVSLQEELDRVCPVVEAVAREFDVTLSVDTYKSRVAEAALGLGATMVNDISGLTFDEDMVGVVAKAGASLVIMHISGTPATMQDLPRYNDLLADISGFLETSIGKARSAGIDDSKIILDPGIGFGKTLEDNYRIIRNIPRFKQMGFSLMIGVSRKSLIGKLYEADYDRLPATVALNAIAAFLGADIVRVHDVHEHRIALKSIDLLKEPY